jgi:hypothetical protein
MRKLTQAHKREINMLVLKTTQDYIDFSTTQWGVNFPITAENLQFSTLDIQHNVNALVAFNTDNNVQNLHDNIMQQDTFVREYYISVLQYIESNNLISAHKYCCV